MKNKKNKFIAVLLVLGIGIFANKLTVEANTINSINIDVFVEQDGTGKVTEVWDGYFDEGTEVYKVYGNLKNYEIKNLKVKDEDGREYTTLDKWNTSLTMTQKAYKCGILPRYDSVELCWGMSEYGNKTYTVEYEIGGLVQQLNDAQTIYFTFLSEGMDPTPKSGQVTISSEKVFTNENTKIWSFGYDGDINVVDGKVVLKTNGKYRTYSYMTALVKFEENMFTPTVKIDKNFDKLQKEALRGSDYDIDIDTDFDSKDKDSLGSVAMGIFSSLFGIMMFTFGTSAIVPLLIMFIFGVVIKAATAPRDGQLNFTNTDKIMPDKDKVDYYREIPCNGNIYKGYFLMDNYITFVYDKDKKAGLMGAMFLRWVRAKRVKVVETKGGIFDFGKNEYALDLTLLEPVGEEVEDKLIELLKRAAGTNSILEAKEFERWCASNYYQIDSWFELANRAAIKEYVREGAIVEREVESKSLMGNRVVKQSFVNPEVKEDAIKLLGLRRFLLDFSLIAQREAIEVMLWDDYLVFANILNIADRVEKQFKELYPEFSNNFDPSMNLTVGDLTACARTFSYRGVSAASDARRRSSSSSGGSSSSSRSRSSGGGGRSSSRGGGRSSGGRSSRGGGTR